ncbi:MAG: hypothetical protein ACE5LC_08025 [Candidatus Aminicenantales bacterium]
MNRKGAAISREQKGVDDALHKSRPFLSMPHPVLLFFFLSLLFLAGIFFTAKKTIFETPVESQSPVNFYFSPNKGQFSHLQEAKNIPFRIKSRNNIDRGRIHLVHIVAEVPPGLTQTQLLGVSEKIVKAILSRELCHGISIDFVAGGSVDFAPFGNWAKAGEVPIDNYRDYQFRYFPSRR